MTALRHLTGILLALVALGFAGVLWLYLVELTPEYSLKELAAPALAYLLLAFAALVFIAVVLYGISLLLGAVGWLIVRLGSASSFRETSLPNKLFGLLLAVLLFPGVFASLYMTALRFFTELFVELPRSLARLVGGGAACVAEADQLGRCAEVIIGDLVGGLTSVVNAIVFRTGLGELDIVSLLLALVVFVLASVGLQRAWQHSSPAMRSWLAYAAIAVVGLYLALSATLAVGLLQDARQVGEIAPERLRERLESAQLETPIAGVDIGIPWDGASQPDAGGLPAVGSDNEPTGLPGWLPLALGEADQVLRDIERYGRDVASRRRQLVGGFAADKERMIENAVALYETESAVRIGTREASRHYLDIINWFLRQAEQLGSAVATCGRAEMAIDAIRKDAEADRRDITSLVRQNIQRLERGDGADLMPLDALMRALHDHGRRAAEESSRCWVVQDGMWSPPARPVYGSSLGPVGAATRWLLSAESMPVTLVVGLVGFGLLGALVGRFVRGEHRADTGPGEVAVVVFGGFVAALVVYLGAYGGIAVISESGGDPNAYVVFAACLIGAVYSSDVWERARERLLGAQEGRLE